MADKKPTKEKLFKVTMIDGADRHDGKGDTIYDAFKSITPFTSKKMVQVQVEFNGKLSKTSLRLVPLKVKRLFENDMDTQLQAKRLGSLI